MPWDNWRTLEKVSDVKSVEYIVTCGVQKLWTIDDTI
jgi:hypothetical protein